MTKRYVLCGASNRGIASFALPILGVDREGQPAEEGHADVAHLVALVEPDAVRAKAVNDWMASHGLPALACHDSLEGLLTDPTAPTVDAVIVASPDHTHVDHIRTALAHGLDVITEKPMVTTTEDAKAVIAAEAASTGQVRVTHNFRYPPRHLQLKELIRSGRIGTVVQVLLDYHVDTAHGASYFVRWNRAMAASGGLTLHKSTHHLDLVNWLIDDEPTRVAAAGGRWFYGPDSPHRPRGADGAPLTGAALREADPYWQTMLRHGDVHDPQAGQPRHGLLDLPYQQQYPPDVEFSVYDDEIDTLDTVSSVIGYRGGAAASYLVNFSSPWEGFRLVVTGTHGQLETLTGHVAGDPLPDSDVITLRPLFGAAETIPVATATGGHGGADPLLRHDLFHGPSDRSLKLGLPASARQGGLAVAAGEALWRSAATGETIPIEL